LSNAHRLTTLHGMAREQRLAHIYEFAEPLLELSVFHRGLVAHFPRLKKNGNVVYGYSVIPPLEIAKLLDLLYEQHSRAMLLFKAYWELLNELCNKWSEERPPVA